MFCIEKTKFESKYLIYCNRNEMVILSRRFSEEISFIHTFTEEVRTFSLLRVGGKLLNANLP